MSVHSPKRNPFNLAQIPVCPCCSSRFCAGVHLHSKKIPQNTLTKLRVFEVFAFKCVLTGPRGCSESMRFSPSEAMGSSGASHNIFIWLWLRKFKDSISFKIFAFSVFCLMAYVYAFLPLCYHLCFTTLHRCHDSSALAKCADKKQCPCCL
jgi:hypothetical protein